MTTDIRRIVVGIDGSDNARRAAEWAAALRPASRQHEHAGRPALAPPGRDRPRSRNTWDFGPWHRLVGSATLRAMRATFDTDRPVSHRGGARTLSLPSALGLSWVIARRALELTHDRGVSTAEGTEHLTRLADHRDLPLRAALAHLRPDDAPDTARGHACTLLELAIDALTGGCVKNG